MALNLGANTSNARPTLNPNGATVTVPNSNFYVFVDVSLVAPVAANGTVRFELGGGLRWGADDPDPTDQCTSTPTTGQCEARGLQPIAGMAENGWFFDVVAPGNGTYSFRGELAAVGDSDTDLSNNTSSITIVVDVATGGGGGGSGGGGGGGTTAASASAARVTPAKPKAGSAVSATVRVTAGGIPVRPSRVACVGAIGSAKLRGAARAASGSAACTYRTPKAAKGKTLRGSVSFTARGERFTRRFAAKLG